MADTTGSGTAVRTVASVVTTNLSAAITGPAGAFSQRDKGAPISGTGIPLGATVLSVTDATHATLSANATASGTVAATVGPRLPSSAGFVGWKPDTDAQEGVYSVASANAGVTTPDRLADTNTRAVGGAVEH